jgi:hypothetical protein
MRPNFNSRDGGKGRPLEYTYFDRLCSRTTVENISDHIASLWPDFVVFLLTLKTVILQSN